MKQIFFKSKQILLCVIFQIMLTGICLAGCTSTVKTDAKYTPSGNHLTDETRESFFQKRGKEIYRAAISGIWYPFGWESPYLFVDIGADYPVMLTSGKTFDYKTVGGEKIQTCMECEVYYHDDGQYILLGTLDSLSTGYPIAYDETGFYEAGAYGVRKWILDESCPVPCLKTEMEVFLSDVEDKNAEDTNIAEYNRLYNNYLSAAIIDYGDSHPFLYKYYDEEVKLLQLLEAETGCKITEYKYIDMDHDGNMEIIGAYKENKLWHILYLCSDDGICRELESFRYDHCNLLSFVPYDDQTYLGVDLIVNVYNDTGVDKRFSIYELENHTIEPIISNQFGYIYINDISEINQILYLNVEDYGDGYSAVTYLHFDGNTYKECGLLELSEEQFMQYDNAEEVLSNIRADIGSDAIELSYYLQEPYYVHIQCESKSESGDSQFSHFTLSPSSDNLLRETSISQHPLTPATAKQNTHDKPLYNRHEGRLKEFYTDLEVIYPDFGN